MPPTSLAHRPGPSRKWPQLALPEHLLSAWASCVYSLFLQQCYEAGTTNVPILQMRRLKPRDWRCLCPRSMATRWKTLPCLPPLNP